MPEVSYFLAFTAGFLSFISPCVLPLVPSYVSYLTGLSVEELASEEKQREARWRVLSHSLSFIFGFSTIFIFFGASATFLGQLFLSNQDFIRRLGGLLIILFGLSLVGVLRAPFLMSEKRVHFTRRPAGYIGSFLIGVTFAAGWTPCVGPILGSILLYASTADSVGKGIELLVVYSIGLGLPFLVVSVGINVFLGSLRKILPYFRLVSVVSGVFLITVGMMIYTNSLTRVVAFLSERGIGWYVGQ